MNEFERIFSLIHNEIKPNVGYVQFKKMLIVYSENIMKRFLNGKSMCICHIEPLKNGLRGTSNYNKETNRYRITINEEVVKAFMMVLILLIYLLFFMKFHMFMMNLVSKIKILKTLI